MNQLQSRLAFDPASLTERIGEDPELIRELALIFTEDAAKLIESIKQAIAAGDHAALEYAAHSLKGSALNFGARAVSELWLELETLGRSGRTEVPEQMVVSLGTELCRLSDRLRKYAEKAQPSR